MLIALGILGLVGLIGGAIVSAAGRQHQIDAQAAADEMQAENLEELSAEGGYYDQVLAALQTELDDIEADRAAALTNLQMTEKELTSAMEVSKVEEAAQVAGQAVRGLETARAGAEAKGGIKAAAGAGGVSVGSGSVLRTAAAVSKAVGRQVAVANLGIQATRAAGAYQRMTIEDNMVRARLQYEDTIRATETREAQITAQTTLTEYQQETGLEQAEFLRSEGEWLETTGTALNWLGAGFQVAGDVASFGMSLGGGAPAAAATGGPGWGGTGMDPATVHGFLGGYTPTTPTFSYGVGGGGGGRTEFTTGGSY